MYYISINRGRGETKMKKLNDGTYKVTKKEESIGRLFCLKFISNPTVKVNNEIEHKIALDLVKSGDAKVIKKKNYGKIAEIENLDFEY
tara:strand:- start:2335 stop:2598 length:264 start_codon:yes stop_codon:yes gene_type:complete